MPVEQLATRTLLIPVRGTGSCGGAHVRSLADFCEAVRELSQAEEQAAPYGELVLLSEKVILARNALALDPPAAWWVHAPALTHLVADEILAQQPDDTGQQTPWNYLDWDARAL